MAWEDPPAEVAARLGRLGERVRFVATHGCRTVAAVERVAAGDLLERNGERVQVRRADLVCAVGREAGSAAAAAAAAAAVTDAGEELLAMVSQGRSTVLAVRPEGSNRVLNRLHEVFFPSAG